MDYLELYKKFNEVKDIADYIDDVEKLRCYYGTQQYQLMIAHINFLTKKYPVETRIWNLRNTSMPTTEFEAYQNAEGFMKLQGAKLIVSKVINYQEYLSPEEKSYMEIIIKFME